LAHISGKTDWIFRKISP